VRSISHPGRFQAAPSQHVFKGDQPDPAYARSAERKRGKAAAIRLAAWGNKDANGFTTLSFLGALLGRSLCHAFPSHDRRVGGLVGLG
jgi:hypothetical protein